MMRIHIKGISEILSLALPKSRFDNTHALKSADGFALFSPLIRIFAILKF